MPRNACPPLFTRLLVLLGLVKPLVMWHERVYRQRVEHRIHKVITL